MTANQILDSLQARDITVTLNGDRLKIDAPAGSLTDEDRAQLRECKAELLKLLASDAFEPIKVCPICAGDLKEQRGKNFKHIWCPTPGHFDAWRADGGRRLSDTDAPIIRARGGQR